MRNLTFKKFGLLSAHDSGAPAASQDYTTLVLLHGFAWHSGIFKRLLPFSHNSNTRIILVNRRDYPGSVPFEDAELHGILSLKAATPHDEALTVLSDYMKQRAKELYDFLGLLIESERLPMKGGLVVAGWSFGTNWITALLANASSFPVGTVAIASYIRRLVLLDPPYHCLGYPPPEKYYNPLTDPSHAPGEGVKLFPAWVSGYYIHGDSASKLEYRVALSDPPPTIQTLSPEDIESLLFLPPGSPGGSDIILVEAGIQHGLYSTLRKAILYAPTVGPSNDVPMNEWNEVELRYVWCDRSVWEMPWGTWALKEELQEAKTSGRPVKPIQIVRLEGANHFAHWDQPERLLQALLSDDIQSGGISMTVQKKG